MDNRPIGVFDSGLGGLTAVKELLSLLPGEDIVYFGDTGRVPYGTRSVDTILRYTKQDIAFLQTNGVKFILAACGTVSSVADEIGGVLPVPFTGVLQPTALAAAEATRTGKIGVIGTTATIGSGAYRRHLKAVNPSIEVFEQACPLFVPLVENGFVAPDDPITRLTAERYLSAFDGTGIDTLVLGCTHYPIIRDTIAAVVGSGVALIDSGREAALYCAQRLRREGLLSGAGRSGGCRFFVSDHVDGFYSVANLFLGREIDADVAYVDIGAYPARI